MPKLQSCPVKDLKLDLRNYRTVPQATEEKSVHALISIDPDYFWALTESLLEDGWHGTENVLVLADGTSKIVKEGNRRIGAIKLILGKFKLENFTIPVDVKKKIEAVTAQWKKDNAKIQCLVFSKAEEAQVEKVVSLTHAKGEKAGRLAWNAVARARFKRDESGGSEPGLDLLENYLKIGGNVDATQKELWAGEYPLSVLDEVLKKLAPRLGVADWRAAAAQYSKTSRYVAEFEQLLHDIGVNSVGFPALRDPSDDLLARYGFPVPPPPATTPAGGSTSTAGTGSAGTGTGGTGGTGAGPGTGTSAPGTGGGAGKPSPKTVSLNDPRSVGRELRKFIPKGKSASKVVDLLTEAKKLKFGDTPIAFCFIMRAMLEVSVHDYCSKHRIPTVVTTLKGTKDKKLADILVEAANHLATGSTDGKFKSAMRNAAKAVKSPHGTLSVPTMNAVVHSATTTITEADILAGFHQVFPLLVALNK